MARARGGHGLTDADIAQVDGGAITMADIDVELACVSDAADLAGSLPVADRHAALGPGAAFPASAWTSAASSSKRTRRPGNLLLERLTPSPWLARSVGRSERGWVMRPVTS
jgi:hypothetical protein